MSVFSLWWLRPIVSVARELRRLNDSIDAVMLHFEIKTKKQLAEEDALAAKAVREREEFDLLGRPHPDDAAPSQLQLALQQLRDREHRGEVISDDELIAATRAIDEDAASRSGHQPDFEY